MDGFDILKARKKADISQGRLAKALKLKGGRNTITDIENGLVEVTPTWALDAIKAVNELAETERVKTGVA